MSSGALPSRVEVAPPDPGCRWQHNDRTGLCLRSGRPPLRGCRRPLLPPAPTAPATRRQPPSPPPPQPRGLVGRGRGALQEQQHRRSQVEGETPPGGPWTRQARVKTNQSLSLSLSSSQQISFLCHGGEYAIEERGGKGRLSRVRVILFVREIKVGVEEMGRFSLKIGNFNLGLATVVVEQCW